MHYDIVFPAQHLPGYSPLIRCHRGFAVRPIPNPPSRPFRAPAKVDENELCWPRARIKGLGFPHQRTAGSTFDGFSTLPLFGSLAERSRIPEYLHPAILHHPPQISRRERGYLGYIPVHPHPKPPAIETSSQHAHRPPQASAISMTMGNPPPKVGENAGGHPCK